MFISRDNIKTIGGDKFDGITKTTDFLKDMDLYSVRLLYVTSTSHDFKECRPKKRRPAQYT